MPCIAACECGRDKTAPSPNRPASASDLGPKPETYRGMGASKLTNPCSGMMCRIGRSPKGDGIMASSPRSKGLTTVKYCSKSFNRCGGRPMTRIAVLPAPSPKKVLPGAKALMVAMDAALTGAGLVPDIATPVPRRMVCVRLAASARQA